MENKKYLDKVIDHMVRGTKIDYVRSMSTPPLSLFSTFFFSSHPRSGFVPSPPFLHLSFFSTYCRNTFGLTDEEIDYVWKEYKYIITDKISNREP